MGLMLYTYADFASLGLGTSPDLLVSQWLGQHSLIAGLSVTRSSRALRVHSEREGALGETSTHLYANSNFKFRLLPTPT